MATYKHGVYTSEQATSMTAPVTGTAGLQVVVGTAPVNMLEHPEQAVNTPLLAYNYKEAVAAVGYHDDFAAYTLCESISAAFSVVGTGPLVLINVLDPAKHTADIAETTVQVNSGVAVLDAVGVLLDKLTVKSGSTALTRDTDYTASFNNDGTLNIVPLAGGKAASATTLTVTGKKLDPSKVKAADIVGGVDAATGKETGLEVVRQIYPKLSMTPGILLAPRFSIFKSITFDNGTEFAAAEELERSCVNKRLPRTKVYFCHPYSSWERGTNENTNGMIRRRFPKGTNFAAVTNAQITQAENWINNYPRKILGYKSSEIVFRECLRELGIAA